MARLITKKKGYNNYLRYAIFSGYGLTIELSASLLTDPVDHVKLYLSQKATHSAAELFFSNRDLKGNNTVVEKKVGFRMVRYLAEKCVQAEFTLVNHEQHSELNGNPTRGRRTKSRR